MQHEEAQYAHLLRSQDAIIFALARLAESRDLHTDRHLERISLYAVTLAKGLNDDSTLSEFVDADFIRWIGIASALHDIGKVGVSEQILLKTDELTFDELAELHSHTLIGAECLGRVSERAGDSPMVKMARDIAIAHHENWDGTGYPNGLSGNSIPLAARIVALCDVYEALTNRRRDREALSHDKCIRLIVAAAGRQFDPNLVDAFLMCESEFASIADGWAEPSDRSVFGKDVSDEAARLMEAVAVDQSED